MNILYIYAHPNPNSFNNALKEIGIETLSTANHNVIVSDLYALNFNAVASWHDFNFSEAESANQYFIAQKIAYDKNVLSDDIKKEIEKITWADHIIFQFPLWWFSMPAIMKGWMDRILVKGFAYDSGKIFKDGLLQNRSASLVVSTQSPEAAYQLDGVHGEIIDSFLHPINHTLKFAGIELIEPFITYGAFEIDEARKINIFADYQNYLKNL